MFSKDLGDRWYLVANVDTIHRRPTSPIGYTPLGKYNWDLTGRMKYVHGEDFVELFLEVVYERKMEDGKAIVPGKRRTFLGLFWLTAPCEVKSIPRYKTYTQWVSEVDLRLDRKPREVIVECECHV